MSKQEKKVVGDVKSFIVERKKWLRGEGSEDSCLLTEGNRMCCLGFYAEACGLDRKVIRGLSSPMKAVYATQGHFIENYKDKLSTRKSDVIWKTKLVKSGRDTATCNDMMKINDDEHIDDTIRETKLTALFKKLGIRIKFG
jgi:hypothetical protein